MRRSLTSSWVQDPPALFLPEVNIRQMHETNTHPYIPSYLYASILYHGKFVLDIDSTWYKMRRRRRGRYRALLLTDQGALAFELWTGQPAPLRVMSNALTWSLTVPA